MALEQLIIILNQCVPNYPDLITTIMEGKVVAHIDPKNKDMARLVEEYEESIRVVMLSLKKEDDDDE